MAFLILMGTAALLAVFFVVEGLLHLREATGPWTLNRREYDDAWHRRNKKRLGGWHWIDRRSEDREEDD